MPDDLFVFQTSLESKLLFSKDNESLGQKTEEHLSFHNLNIDL